MAAIGFRVRTGYATAVLLAGPVASPRVLTRRRVDLCDMDDPDARQPYHVVTEQDERRGMALVRRAETRARTAAAREVGLLMRQAAKEQLVVGALGLVGGSDVDPATILHPHIRAHAMEGRLYGESVEASAAAHGLKARVLVERDAYGAASLVLGRSPMALRSATSGLGHPMGRPWGAQEKMAALAAWVSLAALRQRARARPRH